MNYPTTLREMLSMREWDYFIGDKLGNNLFLTDPDRANRLHEAAEDGADGSTHAEHIEDWRDFLSILKQSVPYSEEQDEIREQLEKIADEIDAKEEYLDKNGQLDKVIG
jgi:hypothetical protein